jgi:hypothetical protein
MTGAENASANGCCSWRKNPPKNSKIVVEGAKERQVHDMRSLRTLSSQMKEMLAHVGDTVGVEHSKSSFWVALVVVGCLCRMVVKDRVLCPRSSMLKACGVEWRVLRCVGRGKTSCRPVIQRSNMMNSDVHQRFPQTVGRCTEAEMTKVLLVKFRFSTKFAILTLMVS